MASAATLSDAIWSMRRFVEANVRPLAAVYYAPPQEEAPEATYVLFRPLRLGSLGLFMYPTVRLSAVARGGVPGADAQDLASAVAGVFDAGDRRATFDCYDKETATVVGTCVVIRVDPEPLVQFPDGTDVVPVDVTFRFRSTYAPRV